MFEDKVAIITGGSEGIGLAIAKELATQGAYVFIIGRTLGSLEHAENEIIKLGGKVGSRSANINDSEMIMEVVDYVLEEHNRLDIFINNAGAWAHQGLEDSFRDIRELIELDMKAPYELTHCLINKFKEDKEHNLKILTVVSQSALGVYEGGLGYGVGKTGLTSGLMHLEKEMKKDDIKNIDLYRLYPGTVATRKMLEALEEDDPMIDAVTTQAVADTASALLLEETKTRDVKIAYYPGQGVKRTYYPSDPNKFYNPPELSEEFIDADFTPKDIVIPEPIPPKY